jgi:hypothetical protein
MIESYKMKGDDLPENRRKNADLRDVFQKISTYVSNPCA